MAEEDDELQGMDDFDADDGLSSDQFDELMEDDLGGEDSDRDLDSFFEDLSTVDDLDVQEEETEESFDNDEPDESFDDEPDESFDDEPDESFDDEPAKSFDEEDSQKKPLLIPGIISGVSGAVLGSLTIAILAWMNQPTELPPPVPEPVVEVAPEPEPLPLPPPVPEPVVEVAPEPEPPPPPPKPEPVAEPEPTPPKEVIQYYVQVANCIHQECADDFRFLLQRYGYKPILNKHVEVNNITEVVSRQQFGEEDAARWVSRINDENTLPGYAFRKQQDDKFSISLGLFPDLNVAVRVRSHLNQLYLKQLYFIAQQAQQDVEFIRVQIGGDTDKEKAIQLRLEVIEKDQKFKDAFIVPVSTLQKAN